MTRLRAGSATDVGLVRSNNQDRLLVADPLFAVADGMGGAAAGEVASATAIEGLGAAFDAAQPPTLDSLIEAAHSANRAVWEQAESNPDMRGMGTTLVALALLGDGRLGAINIGDSRLYVYRDGSLRQITSDHNLVAELVAEGRISKEEAEVHPRRNIMTRALGVDPEVPVDFFREDPVPGDRYLLCSDGLPRELRDEHIASLLSRFADPGEAAKELVEEAKRRGGNDNITVVVVDVEDPGKEAAGAAAADGATAAAAASAAGGLAEDQKSGTRTAAESAAKGTGAADVPRARLITPRVVAFFVLLLAIVAGAAAITGWYARSGYFVGLRGDRVTVFRGEPGGVLWFHPTVADATHVTTRDVLQHQIPRLRAGQTEPSLQAARQYVMSLVAEAQAARAAAAPPPAPAATTTTKPPTSTASPPPTT